MGARLCGRLQWSVLWVCLVRSGQTAATWRVAAIFIHASEAVVCEHVLYAPGLGVSLGFPACQLFTSLVLLLTSTVHGSGS